MHEQHNTIIIAQKKLLVKGYFAQSAQNLPFKQKIIVKFLYFVNWNLYFVVIQYRWTKEDKPMKN